MIKTGKVSVTRAWHKEMCSNSIKKEMKHCIAKQSTSNHRESLKITSVKPNKIRCCEVKLNIKSNNEGMRNLNGGDFIKGMNTSAVSILWYRLNFDVVNKFVSLYKLRVCSIIAGWSWLQLCVTSEIRLLNGYRERGAIISKPVSPEQLITSSEFDPHLELRKFGRKSFLSYT